MTAAEWPYPPRDGVTIWHVTDTHFKLDKYLWNEWFKESMIDDVAAMPRVDVRVHTGDIVAGPSNAGELPDTETLAWLNAALGGPEDVWVMGNHDFIGAGGQDAPIRDRADWEGTYGRSALTDSLTTSPDGTQVRILGFGPDSFDFGNPDEYGWDIPAATLDWLDSRLAESPVPTFLACHFLLEEHRPSPAESMVAPGQSFRDLISDNPHICGYLAGHNHWGVDDPKSVKEIAVGNRTSFPSIKSPAAFHTPGISKDYGERNDACFVTFIDTDRIEVRYRRHNGRKWLNGADGNRVTVLSNA